MSGSGASTPSDTLPSLVLQSIGQAEALLDELKRQLHHFGPDAFADAIGKKLTKFRDEFSHKLERRKGNEEHNEEHVEGVCQEFLVRIRKLVHESFPILAPISNIFIPAGLLLPIKNFARKFGDFELSFSPCWVVNYEFQERVTNTTKPFLFISYPLVEWTNTLLHVLLIHEVFHYVEFTERLSDTLGEKIALEKADIQEIVNRIIRTQAIGRTAEEGVGKIESIVHAKCLAICMCWLGEFICDLFSIKIVGPAYFFALEQFGRVTDSMTQASDTHPPMFVRMRHVLNELKQMNYLTEQHSLTQTLRDWDEKLSMEPGFQFGTPLQEATHRHLEKNFDTITGDLQEKFRELEIRGAASFHVGHFREAEKIVEKYFCKGIPAIDIWDENSEENEPLDMLTIWNAGWLTYTKFMEKFYITVGAHSEKDKENALINFNAIVLKSLESSETLRIVRSNS